MKHLATTLALLSLSVLLATAPAAAQEPWREVFEDVTEINVINVEVIVTDAKGQPVTGLGQDDFEPLEDGKPVDVSNFYAVESGETVTLPAGDGEAEAASPERTTLQLLILRRQRQHRPRQPHQDLRPPAGVPAREPASRDAGDGGDQRRAGRQLDAGGAPGADHRRP